MTKLPIVNANRMGKLLESAGFAFTHQKGSHKYYRHTDGRWTCVPYHKGKDLPRPLIRTILQEIDMSVADYVTRLLET